MPDLPRDAPPLQVAQWFNTPAPLSLEALRGKDVFDAHDNPLRFWGFSST